MSASLRLIIFPTDYTYLLGTCPLGLVKKERPVCIATSWKAVIVSVRFFSLHHLQLCQTSAWKLLIKLRRLKCLEDGSHKRLKVLNCCPKFKCKLTLTNTISFIKYLWLKLHVDLQIAVIWEKKNNDNICSDLSF